MPHNTNRQIRLNSNNEYIDVSDYKGNLLFTLGVQTFSGATSATEETSVDLIIPDATKQTITARAIRKGRMVLDQVLNGTSVLTALLNKVEDGKPENS